MLAASAGRRIVTFDFFAIKYSLTHSLIYKKKLKMAGDDGGEWKW